MYLKSAKTDLKYTIIKFKHSRDDYMLCLCEGVADINNY